MLISLFQTKMPSLFHQFWKCHHQHIFGWVGALLVRILFFTYKKKILFFFNSWVINFTLFFRCGVQAGLHTRLGQWWDGIPLLTSAVVVVCGIIYLVCLLVGYDSFFEICFLPSAILSHFQGTYLQIEYDSFFEIIVQCLPLKLSCFSPWITLCINPAHSLKAKHWITFIHLLCWVCLEDIMGWINSDIYWGMGSLHIFSYVSLIFFFKE